MAAEDYLSGPGESFDPSDWLQTKTTNNTKKGKITMSDIPMPELAPTSASGNATAKAAPSNTTKGTAKAAFTFGEIDEKKRGQIVILYGEGGTGKTTLAAQVPGKTAFIDLEKSLALLAPTFKTLGIGSGVKAIREKIDNFKTLCDLMNAPIYDGFDNVVVDSLSTVQELAKVYTYAHSPTKAKTRATCLDDYEYSSGPMYVFRWFVPNFWAAIEKHADAGRNVIIIAHEVYETIPNGDGTEYKQYQFDALTMKSGKDSIRHFMCNNADHVLFLKADICGDKKKNAIGGNSKTLYAAPLPYIMAKSRTAHDPTFAIDPGETFDWNKIIK